MLEKVFHLLSGYAEFEVRGDSARFFNVAAKSGFGLWGFHKDGDRAVARIKAREYARLRPVCRRCRVRIRMRKKRGAPFQALRLWRRKGLLAGAVCGIGIYAFLSCFVWGVSVSGTELLTDREILDSAARYGVFVGSGKQEFSPKYAAHGILTEVDGLSWAAVNTDGCFAEIVVRESEEKPEITDMEGWSNIVASREGKIVAVKAQRGRPEVKLGDAVQKGQLLISGLYQEEVDPYGPQPDQPLETVGPARGSVTAETYREFTVQVGSRKKELLPTGKKKTNLSLSLFGLRIPLGLNTVPEEECRNFTEVLPLEALGTELPVSLERDVYEFLEESARTLSEEELREAALFKLRETQKAALEPGSRVVKEELSYSFTDGICILNAKCRCEEEIGETRKILVK